jgi:hypothetical protein
MDLVRAALKDSTELDKRLGELKEPTERVRARAVYRSAQDAVPLAESLGDLPHNGGGYREPAAPAINVLIDDYWSIAQVLLH